MQADPQSLHRRESEQALISCLLMCTERERNEALAVAPPLAFADTRLRHIAESVSQLGDVVDLVLLADSLKPDVLQSLGGIAGLSALETGSALPVNRMRYARAVREAWLVRRCVGVMRHAAMELQGGRDSAHVTADVTRALRDICSAKGDSGSVAISPLVREELAKFQARNGRGRPVGVRTGFEALDAKLAGLQAGDFVIVAGRPSMGKTALACDIVRQSGANTLFASLEMSRDAVASRLICAEGRVDSREYLAGRLGDTATQRLVEAVDRVDRMPVRIFDKSAAVMADIERAAYDMADDDGLDLVVVDYLQLIRSDRRHDSREREVAEHSVALKALAKSLQIPVICLAQLNRQVEGRGDKRPVLSDLRESGSLEQDADIVLMLYRESYYKAGQPGGKSEVLVRKHRNGSCGTVRLVFDDQYATFRGETYSESYGCRGESPSRGGS